MRFSTGQKPSEMKFNVGDPIAANNGAYSGVILGRDGEQYHVYWNDKQEDAIHTADFIDTFHSIAH